MYFSEEDLLNDPIPPGRYPATVEATRHTKSRRGNPMILVRLHVAELDRALHDYFVTGGPSPQAVSVSRRRLVALCYACGCEPRPGEFFDLAMLHHQHVLIDVVTEPGENGPWNRIVRYLQADGD